MEGGPARWQKVSDAVAGFLRADGKLAPIYAAKHFEGLAALSTHPAGRRAAVKAGCNPVHFSLDGCPLSCYFSGSVATTSGHFVHKSEGRMRGRGFHIRPVC